MTILIVVAINLTIYSKYFIKIYEILSQKVSVALYKSIKNTRNLRQDKIIKPQSFIYPKIDRNISDFFEWKNSGYYEVGLAGGSMHQVGTVLRSFNFGFDIEKLYLKLDLNKRYLSKLIEGCAFNLILKLFCKLANKQIQNISSIYNGQENIV